jgi:hypothetical protein
MERGTPTEWNTLLQAMLGPDTWFQLNISGPINQEEYEMLIEYLRIFSKRYDRHHKAGGQPSAGDEASRE